MSFPSQLSAEAQRILNDSPQPAIERTAENIPRLRAHTKAAMAPAAERAVRENQVRLRTLDIGGISCLEVSPPKAPASWQILYGFGGGFVQGSPEEDLTIAAPLCAQTGATVVMPSYRLAPEHPWPAAIDDGFAVYRRMAQSPFALAGESAGGNWALALMQRARDEGLPLPRAVALLSPWCDLSNSGDSLSANDGRDPTLRLSDVQASAGHYAVGTSFEAPGVSPLFGDFDPGFPPCLITTGTRDLLLSQAVRLANRLIGAGIRTDLHVWEGLWHVFEWDDRLPEAHQSLSRIAGFLARHMAE